jgi:hypothetical protein
MATEEIELSAPSFISLLEELRLLLDQHGRPHDCVDAALQMIQQLDKCFIVKFTKKSTTAAKFSIVFEPTDLFVRFVAAFRARDWQLVGVIKHQICSSNAEMLALSV